MHLQPPHLKNEKVVLEPLTHETFEALYALASDPLIWEQHPNKDRWKREVFEKFFEGALASGGAFLIRDAVDGHAIGSTRFYDYEPGPNCVKIGYTFFARSHWGGGYNAATKHLMLQYAFQYVSRVIFHIGAQNTRSQIAIGRIGAVKTGEEWVAYYGEEPKLNYVYEIERDDYAGKVIVS